MKYKHVFFIWVLADIFLALGLLCFFIYEQTSSQTPDDLGMFLLVALYGVCFSLPSLIVMLLFHFLFTKNAADKSNYKNPYLMLIVGINAAYLLIGMFIVGVTSEFNIFYLGSTLAGLLSFYLVDKRIKKTITVVNP